MYVAALTFYIDDSGTSPTQNVAVAGGWIARMPAWGFFEKEWDKVRNIESDRFDCFHMADFVDGRGSKNEFKGWSLPRKEKLLKKLRRVVKKRAAKGFALGVIKKDFDSVVPNALRSQGFENHYTYAIRRVLGMIADWRKTQNIEDQSIEYIFDWMDKNDPRRSEIERVFQAAEGTPIGFQQYGLEKGGYSFRDKKSVLPLQAADMFAWLTYNWVLSTCEGKSLNPLAVDSFRDFWPHRNKTFLEGGYNKKEHLVEWVRKKGF